MASILIVEDDKALRESLAETLSDLGYHAIEAASGRIGLDIAAREPIDAVLLDLRMPGMDGLEVLRRLRENRTGAPPVAILTAYATSANTIEAMRLGAFDHLIKPIKRDELKSLISRMLRSRAIIGQVSAPLLADDDELIGPSAAMRSVEKTIGLVADSDATVLITGETGTGKEVVARAIHRHGRRGSGPFVAVNCAAIPAELLESELFGHVRGAFTGAVGDRKGAFREAEHGTLFLDEIGDMDSAMQAKILRALQERVVTPVGGKPVAVDVRVIAATHRDLQQRIRDGSFREDLFYRLHVIPIHLPAVRERIADIVPLAEHFLSRAGGNKRLAANAAALLVKHTWPGNVRELKNAMERAAVLARGDVINASDLGFIEETQVTVGEAADWPEEDLPSAIVRLEEMLIRRALARTAGNRAEAARLLGIHRQLLYTKMKRHGLDLSEDRTDSVGNPDDSERRGTK
jgi:DNA-binding NtrC family response regulator